MRVEQGELKQPIRESLPAKRTLKQKCMMKTSNLPRTLRQSGRQNTDPTQEKQIEVSLLVSQMEFNHYRSGIY